MRAKPYQTCQCCGAGPVAVLTVGEHLRRFFGLSARHACRRCLDDLGRRREAVLKEAA